MHHLVTPLTTPISRWSITRWAERSQQRACRNAMVASTELAHARRERSDVERYVVGTLARRHPVAPDEATSLAAVGG